MCAAEHSRGVASDEGDRLDMDESSQEDELLNHEDSTFRSRLLSSVEVSTEPPRELEESFARKRYRQGRRTCRVSFDEENFQEVEEFLFFESSLRGFLRRSRRNSVINPGPRQGFVHGGRGKRPGNLR